MSAGQIVEVSNPAFLKTEKKQLLIEQKSEIVARISFEDLQVILLANPQITVSIGVLQQCVKNNLPVIVCDHKYLPCGYLHAPLSNSLHTKILKYQVEAKAPLKKQIWKRIVMAKVKHQAALLESKNKVSQQLWKLLTRIRSGDPDNIEAQAASIYWRELFGSRFRRDPNAEGINSLLNYGYAIIRAATGRALAGSGLNTTLGIFHRNQYNHFCLADDMMEVIRPMVDAVVFELVAEKNTQVNQHTKRALLDILQSEVQFSGEFFYLAHALQRSSKSLTDALVEKKPNFFQHIELI
ncbi:type II CRISPR-associated endonuclease Cas1 [bacterium]|nr:type II CRISPR-associated endonuclease Cas1 [bacterium]